jgi:hypothetical protein
MTITAQEVRKQAWMFLSPEVAGIAGLSLAELQQFVAGTVTLSAQQVEALASRMGMTFDPIRPAIMAASR